MDIFNETGNFYAILDMANRPQKRPVRVKTTAAGVAFTLNVYA